MSLRSRQIFLNSVNIVLCGNSKQHRGAAIAWGTKVEKDHALISLPKHAEIMDCIVKAENFSISVLAYNQAHIAQQYGGRSQAKPREIDPTDLDFTQWTVPVVRGACAQLLCRTTQMLEVREQTLVVCEITEVVALETVEPLRYDHSDFFAI